VDDLVGPVGSLWAPVDIRAHLGTGTPFCVEFATRYGSVSHTEAGVAGATATGETVTGTTVTGMALSTLVPDRGSSA
jgi:hypothetical protein